ncbi:hypothetical protein [Streptomyces flavidovirens]|uniref:hypothetical protein n=1 Tax=Streptomyces flavidovirens TaxID=67298 RepID=UPI0004917241|nr:hypothetical protein [Streptomyces flavidovirens]
MDIARWASLGAVGVGFVAFIGSLRSTVKARVKQIEDDYIGRYWHLLDLLPAEALVNQRPRRTSDEARRVARLYLRLCEDEMTLRAIGWVSRDTWSEWRGGIRAQLHRWPVADEWQRMSTGDLAQATRDQFERLRRLDSNPGYDPCERIWVIRKWRGL